VPQLPLTASERRLALFCRALAALYFAAAAAFAIFFRSFAAQPATAVLALAMATAVGTACLVAAARPRERRHAALVAVVAQLTATLAGAGWLLFGERSAQVVLLVVLDLPLLLLTTWAYRSAAPGVHSEPAREGPPAEVAEPAQVKLKVSKR